MAFPEHVAPDELIESAWGNAVVDALFTVAVAADINGQTREGGRLRIQAGVITATTDVNGDITIPLGGAAAYDGNPVTLIIPATPTQPLMVTVLTSSPASATARVWWGSGAGIGTPVANGTFAFFWFAIGLRP